MAALDPAAPFAGVPFLAEDFGIHFASKRIEMGSRLTAGTRLPIGMHFIGRLGSEDMLLALGRQLEEAMPWRDRTPPLFG